MEVRKIIPTPEDIRKAEVIYSNLKIPSDIFFKNLIYSSLGVTVYLAETKQCVLGNKWLDSETWTTDHLANLALTHKPVRLDILQWLHENKLFNFKDHHKKITDGRVYQWEAITFAECALEEKCWPALQWLFDTKIIEVSPGAWINSIHFGYTLRGATRHLCPQVLLFLQHFYDSFSDEERLSLLSKYHFHSQKDDKNLVDELFHKSIMSACRAKNFTVFEALKDRLVKIENDHSYSWERTALGFCMETLYRVDVERAVKFGLDALSKVLSFEKSNRSIRLRLVDILLNKNIVMNDEAEDILQAFLYDNYHLRNSVQGLYLLKDLSDDEGVLQLRHDIHWRLSKPLGIEQEPSVNTWLPQVIACYPLYLLYKNSKGNDPFINDLCQRGAQEYKQQRRVSPPTNHWATHFQGAVSVETAPVPRKQKRI